MTLQEFRQFYRKSGKLMGPEKKKTLKQIVDYDGDCVQADINCMRCPLQGTECGKYKVHELAAELLEHFEKGNLL